MLCFKWRRYLHMMSHNDILVYLFKRCVIYQNKISIAVNTDRRCIWRKWEIHALMKTLWKSVSRIYTSWQKIDQTSSNIVNNKVLDVTNVDSFKFYGYVLWKLHNQRKKCLPDEKDRPCLYTCIYIYWKQRPNVYIVGQDWNHTSLLSFLVSGNRFNSSIGSYMLQVTDKTCLSCVEGP